MCVGFLELETLNYSQVRIRLVRCLCMWDMCTDWQSIHTRTKVVRYMIRRSCMKLLHSMLGGVMVSCWCQCLLAQTLAANGQYQESYMTQNTTRLKNTLCLFIVWPFEEQVETCKGLASCLCSPLWGTRPFCISNGGVVSGSQPPSERTPKYHTAFEHLLIQAGV